MPINRIESGIAPLKSRLIELGGTFNDTVASFGSYTKIFTPPKGVKWEIINMRLLKGFPTGGSVGTNGFTVSVGNAPQIYGESVFGSKIEWRYNTWITADSLKYPVAEDAAILALQRIVSNRGNPLTVRFDNSTDVNNTKLGEIYIQVLERPVV